MRSGLDELAPDATSISELSTLLAERLCQAGRELDALRALSIVDPASAARWIVDGHTANGASSRAAIGAIVATIAEAAIADPQIVSGDDLLELVARYGDLLPDHVALELTSALREISGDAPIEAALTAALTRAADAPGLLRASAEIAVGRRDGVVAHDLLTRLGRADRSPATVRYAQHARRALAKCGDPEIRIALLSSFTIDPVVPYVDLECRALRLEPTLYTAPFNTWEREMLGQGSALERFQPQIAFLSVALDDLLPELAEAPSAADIAAAGENAIDRILSAASRFSSWASGVLVVHSLYSAFRDPMGPASGRNERSRGEIIAELNARLADGLRAVPRAHLLDMNVVVTRRRHGTLDNPKMRHLAGMRLGDSVLADVAGAYAQFIAPVAGRTRKCIVLDLDNTLWGGIVGEDGPHGIRLGTTSPGSEFREFQQFLLSLAQRGVLLAVISKNNASDALEVIRAHEAMVLREESFSAMRINWENKPNNLISIAEELSLGLDSFVFVDDNEKERALMRQTLPQVLTPELPRDPALYRETLESLPELHVLNVTAEDRSRTRQYIERRQRESLRVSSQTVEEYLRSLSIVALTDPATERTLTRVHQLFQRTNQFNLTGFRYELGELASRSASAEWRVYATSVSDRFGDHGLVAAAVVRALPDEWMIDNLVMSCRVIGYGVEDALLARISREARAAGAKRLLGRFVPSPKNAPAKDYYSRNSFGMDVEVDDVQLWTRLLNGQRYLAPTWIQESSYGA